jgi:hypothetical protein
VVIASMITPTLQRGPGPEGFALQRDDAARTARRVLHRLEQLPGATSACVASDLPFDFMDRTQMFEPEVAAQRPPQPVNPHWISPGCFSTFGTRLLSGRDFNLEESMDPPRAIVNVSFARQLLGVQDAVGHHFRFARPPDLRGEEPPPWIEIVGMSEDALEIDLSAAPKPAVYFPFLSNPLLMASGSSARFAIAVKAPGDPRALISALPKAVGEVTHDAPVFDAGPLLDYVEHTFRERAALEALLSAFGIAAVILGAVGLFGVTAYSVAERAPEIGIRRALGASRGEILRMVLRETGAVVLFGMTLGLVVSWLGRGLLEAFLFGVSAHDPVTYASVCLGVALVATLASLVPARAAAAISPSRALAGR